jgi:4,5-DOPA dioxygenase extradiol
MKKDLMPVLFIGHGSPMNAIEENEISLTWQRLGVELPRPKAILSISAHWEAQTSMVTAMPKPKTIHDFYGFPRELFEVQYPAPGSDWLVGRVQEIVKISEVQKDLNWGLDHGTWSVLHRMYPDACIPVIQLSLNRSQEEEYHYKVGRELQALRNEGVLILGSGNIVHNLRVVDFSASGFDWAVEYDNRVKEWILSGDHQSIINYQLQGRAAALSVNSAEHYLPLLYVLGASDKSEQVKFYNEKIIAGSISMRCVQIG